MIFETARAFTERIRAEQAARRHVLSCGERFAKGDVVGHAFHGNQYTSGEFSAKIAELFSRIHQPDGGFTYQPAAGTEPRSGYAVSPYPERSFAKDVKDLTAEDVASFIVKNGDLWGSESNNVGGWHDPETHKVFLDVSVVSKTPEEARDPCVEARSDRILRSQRRALGHRRPGSDIRRGSKRNRTWTSRSPLSRTSRRGRPWRRCSRSSEN